MENWIKDCGICNEEDLETITKGFEDEKYTVLAFFTDRFQGARGDRFSDLLKDRSLLLECRVFSLEKELWIHRTMLGSPFSWRVAEEKDLDRQYWFSSSQLLDIDKEYEGYKEEKKDAFGCLNLRSTVKGYYSLPIEKEDTHVHLVHFLRYNEDGVAEMVDYRIVRFGKGEENE